MTRLLVAVVAALAVVALIVALTPAAGVPAVSPPPAASTPASVISTPAATGHGTAAADATATLPVAPVATPRPTRTTVPTPAPAVLLAAGDIADCNADGDSQTAALLGELRGTIATLGDNAYENGTRREFADCYGPTWGRYLDRTRPAPGNHDYHTAGAEGYFDYFGSRAGDPDEGYYAFDLGGWRVYSLNSNCEAIGGCRDGSPELDWLRGDLAANPRQCVLAYWHHPRYSSGLHGNQPAMEAIWDTLYDAGAELVLAGHDHSYERLAPISASGDRDLERGVTSFVVGTGGRDHYGFDEILPTSEARNNTAWGVLELTLHAEGWSSRFVPVAGRTFSDQAEGTCH